MLELEIRSRNRPLRRQRVAGVRTTIGRSPRSDIPLDDPFASRLHSELRHDGGSFWLTDLGSANGTYLNDEPVVGPVRVCPGDRMRIGETVLELVETANAPGEGGETVRSALDTATRGARGAPPSSPSSGLATVLATVERAAGHRPEITPRGDLLPLISKVGVALLSPASLDEVLQQILELIFDAIPAERAFLLLREGDGRRAVIKAASYRDCPRVENLEAVEISSSIQQEVLEYHRSVLTSDAQEDERFRHRESVVLSGVRSVMAVPLSAGGEILGMIYVDNPLRVRLFCERDLQLLTTIACVAAIKVENALLLEQRFENERFKQQLNSARNIQTRLLPSSAPVLEGYDLNGVSFPCFEVGGDYFDFIPVGDGRLVLALGDVSGKGLDAALMMSSLHACVRAQAESGVSMAELVQRVNRYLCTTTPRNRFATLFCAHLDAAQHLLTFANAGHNPPVVLHPDGTIATLDATGMPVGMVEQAQMTSAQIALDPGDLLVVYSDGLSEAENPDGVQFGEERLTQVLLEHGDCATARLRDRIDEALLDFMGTASPSDDLTMVLARRIAS